MKNITKILFVCHGNICRSPMAEFLLKEALKRLKVQKKFEISSAAISNEEIGNSVYPPVKQLLEKLQINCSQKKARQITRHDLEDYDLIVLMDDMNRRYLNSMFKDYPKKKIKLLMEFTGYSRDIDDPWYTQDFETTKKDISLGLQAMLHAILPELDQITIAKSCAF